MNTPAEHLQDQIESEREWRPSTAALRDAILRQFTERLDAIAEKHPAKLGKAIAIVVHQGPGRTVLVISDPDAADLVAELERYKDQDNPLEALLQAHCQI